MAQNLPQLHLPRPWGVAPCHHPSAPSPATDPCAWPHHPPSYLRCALASTGAAPQRRAVAAPASEQDGLDTTGFRSNTTSACYPISRI